jgi:acyl dehydratase
MTTLNFEVDHLFDERVFVINRELLKKYADASGDQNPIHQNEEFAKSVGLPDVIAHGMLTMGLGATYLAGLADSLGGNGSASISSYFVRFVKPVVVPANTDVQLIVSAKVSEVLPNGLRLELVAMCNEVKVLGMAKAVLTL